MQSIWGALSLLTGRSVRHNRALREITDWTGAVQKLLTTYNLYGGSDLNVLLENEGKAKLDLTAIAYNGRPLISRSRSIKGQEISPLVLEIVDTVEHIRRFLINPELQTESLGEAVLNLRSLYETLKDTLSEIEYM